MVAAELGLDLDPAPKVALSGHRDAAVPFLEGDGVPDSSRSDTSSGPSTSVVRMTTRVMGRSTGIVRTAAPVVLRRQAARPRLTYRLRVRRGT